MQGPLQLIAPTLHHPAHAAAISLTALLWGSVAAALTACPLCADLTDGVRLTRSEPYLSMLYRGGGPGPLLELRSEAADTSDIRTLYPHPLAVGVREADGVTLSISYSDSPAALDWLDEIETWGTDITLLQDGEALVDGYFNITFLGQAQIVIGDCTYHAWNSRDILVLGDSLPIIFEKYYAPSLGLVLRAARIDTESSGISTVIMDTIAFEN